MIYCVVPEPLEEELYEKLKAYYADDPNVDVIIDRRKGERRDTPAGGGNRQLRDRRQRSATKRQPLLGDA